MDLDSTPDLLPGMGCLPVHYPAILPLVYPLPAHHSVLVLQTDLDLPVPDHQRDRPTVAAPEQLQT
jgi:hypothetical protein